MFSTQKRKLLSLGLSLTSVLIQCTETGTSERKLRAPSHRFTAKDHAKAAVIVATGVLGTPKIIDTVRANDHVKKIEKDYYVDKVNIDSSNGKLPFLVPSDAKGISVLSSIAYGVSHVAAHVGQSDIAAGALEFATNAPVTACVSMAVINSRPFQQLMHYLIDSKVDQQYRASAGITNAMAIIGIHMVLNPIISKGWKKLGEWRYGRYDENKDRLTDEDYKRIK